MNHREKPSEECCTIASKTDTVRDDSITNNVEVVKEGYLTEDIHMYNVL